MSPTLSRSIPCGVAAGILFASACSGIGTDPGPSDTPTPPDAAFTPSREDIFGLAESYLEDGGTKLEEARIARLLRRLLLREEAQELLEVAAILEDSETKPEDARIARLLLRLLLIEKAEELVEVGDMLCRMHEKLAAAYPEVKLEDPLMAPVGLKLIEAGRTDEGVTVLIREAWLLHRPAQISLQIIGLHGLEDEIDRHDPRILDYHRRAAAEGLPSALQFMGEITLDGLGVEKDREEGLRLLEQSGMLDGLLQAAAVHHEDGNRKGSARCLLRAATECDSAKAWYNLGVFAQEDRDYGDAIALFKKALSADREFHWARLELGRMYMESWGAEDQELVGFVLMCHVATHAEDRRLKGLAEMNIGVFLLNSIGTEQCEEEGIAYLERAAAAGIQEALIVLEQIESRRGAENGE